MSDSWFSANARSSNAIGAIIQAKNTGRILLGSRSLHSDTPGTWCIFGGGIEEGEEPLEALFREFLEEIKTDLSEYGATPLTVFKSPSKDFAYFTLHVQVPEEFVPQLNNEHTGWCWADVRCLPKPMHPKCTETLTFLDSLDFFRKELS